MALIVACLTVVLVAGPLVMAAVPVLALIIWLIRRIAAVLAIAGVATAGGLALSHLAAYPSSHEGSFSFTAQVATALAVAVVILCAGLRPQPDAEAPPSGPVNEPVETGNY
jgi:hypothetical protein